MKLQIERNLLQILFFRPELIAVIKAFLPDIIPVENIPCSCQAQRYFDHLATNGIKIIKKNDEKETEKKEKNKQQMEYIKQIIEKDDFELLQQAFEKDKNVILKEPFFEEFGMNFPILHYCVMKKAMKCFKFLILNGSDPSQAIKNQYQWEHVYEWDCISIAVCFGEWEMMKILEGRGINKLSNPNVWEAAALTHRNKLLKFLISKQDEISNFEECLKKGLLGAVKGNNFKGAIILISKGTDVNTKNNVFQIT